MTRLWPPRPPRSPAGNFRSYTSRCFARVYRHHGQPIDLIGHVEHGRNDGAPTIVSANTAKSIGAPSGTFLLTVRLSPAKFDIHAEIKNADWISIWWQRNDQLFHGTLGNIDGIRRMRTVTAQGATHEEYVITGRDVGKVFETAEVWFNEYVKLGSNVGGRLFAKRMNYVPGGTPDRVVENIIDAFLGLEANIGGAWRWPKGLDAFGEFFVQGMAMRIAGSNDYSSGGLFPYQERTFVVGQGKSAGAPVCRGELIDENSLFQPDPGTKLHDMLVRWSNPILNELFYDIDVLDEDNVSPPERPRPLVVLRERPFVNHIAGAESPWFTQLDTVEVDRKEMHSDDLGSNDAERVNLIMLYARSQVMTQMDQYAAYPPAIDQDDAKAYGLRRWERQIDFAGVGKNGDVGGWGAEIAIWEKLIQSWYGLNHEWLNGSATFKFLLAEARVGKRLVITGEHDVTQAYIESVQHSWSFPGSAQTTLALSRGFTGDNAQLVQAVEAKVRKFRRPVLNGVVDFAGPAAGTGTATA